MLVLHVVWMSNIAMHITNYALELRMEGYIHTYLVFLI